ncbi:MAG: hypothetical protein QMD66_00145 [Actinomycetota bacterium]|nr:hypothetical protein [Actinomycetota bacterium]
MLADVVVPAAAVAHVPNAGAATVNVDAVIVVNAVAAITKAQIPSLGYSGMFPPASKEPSVLWRQLVAPPR